MYKIIIHLFINTKFMYVCLYVLCMRTFKHVPKCASLCGCMCMQKFMYVSPFLYVCMYVRMYVFMYVCM